MEIFRLIVEILVGLGAIAGAIKYAPKAYHWLRSWTVIKRKDLEALRLQVSQVEKDKRESRRMLIWNTRHFLAGATLKRAQIREHAAYSAIRSHLSPELISKIEERNISGGEETIKEGIMKELSDLEQKWDLI